MSNYVLEIYDEFATRRLNENINNFNAGYETALVDILKMIEETESLDFVYESIDEYLFEGNRENKRWRNIVMKKPIEAYKNVLDNEREKADRLRDQYSKANTRNNKKVGNPSLACVNYNAKYQEDRQKGYVSNVPKFTKNSSHRDMLKNELEVRKERNNKGIFNFK